jgi:hypothetical protein
VLLASCNSTSSSPAQTDTLNPASNAAVPSVVAPRYNLSGYLDTLWIPSDSILKLTKKVTFRFYIKDPDTLTLRGWSKDDHIFNNAPPDVILLNGRTSTAAKFGAGDYFGNLQLEKADITIIKNKILQANPRPKYVLFAPEIPGSNGGQINYQILTTNDDPQPLVKIPSPLTTPTGVSTNPSPPRNGT